MARKKRLNNELVLGKEQSIVNKTSELPLASEVYEAALYVRLSAEDNGKIDGNSLENQIALLKNYISDKEEFRLHKIYIDNGESGVSFDRQSFNDMIADMRAGLINCIIVKDLSRLGRNYLETGQYIEQIFPFFHIRFISVMDHYDSKNASALDDSMIIPLKNIINDSYARDISKKVSSAFEIKRKKGLFLGRYAPYGYKKDPDQKGHLIVNEDTADVVRDIFQWKVNGVSNGMIAKRLNAAGVFSPSRYLYSIGVIKEERDSLWTRLLVKRTLENRCYIGDMVSGKVRYSLPDGIKNQQVPKEEWVVVEGTHEPLVSKEIYYAVQDMLKKDAENYGKKRYEGFEVENLFKGKVKCGTCGHAVKMTRVQTTKNDSVTKRVEYICTTYAEHRKAECKQNKILKSELDAAVFEELKAHIMVFANSEQIIRLMNCSTKISGIYEQYEKEIQNCQSRLSKIENLTYGIYEDFKEEVIDEKEYLHLRKTYSEETENLKAKIEMLEHEKGKYSPEYSLDEKVRTLIEKYLYATELTREMVEHFIESIIIYEDKRIKIKYVYGDEIQKLVQEVNKRKGEMLDGKYDGDKLFCAALCYRDIYTSV